MIRLVHLLHLLNILETQINTELKSINLCLLKLAISSRQKLQSLNDKTINRNVDLFKINQTNRSKALGLNIDENLSW